jgi:3-deoxy-D-arabino-heptulosonate 7-phosphate (DAHP) synthase
MIDPRHVEEVIEVADVGIKTFEGTTRYPLHLGSVAVLKEETHLPVIVAPALEE